MEAASSQLSAPALDAEQLEDFAAVFSLLDDQRTGVISEALLSKLTSPAYTVGENIGWGESRP